MLTCFVRKIISAFILYGDVLQTPSTRGLIREISPRMSLKKITARRVLDHDSFLTISPQTLVMYLYLSARVNYYSRKRRKIQLRL